MKRVDSKDIRLKKLMKMSDKKFDEYICNKYPIIFSDRNKPMSETCMCWGFDIGKGWRLIIDELCEKLDTLHRLTCWKTIASQVKEKFGSLRFYVGCEFDWKKYKLGTTNCDISGKNADGIISKIIHDCVSAAERESDYTCANCGKTFCHKKISCGYWIYDLCEYCFLKLHPDKKPNKK